MMYRYRKCSQEKLHFTPVHTLRQLKRAKRCFHHFRGSQSFKQGTVRKLHAGLGAGPNLGRVRLTVEEIQRFTSVLTCPNLSELTPNISRSYTRWCRVGLERCGGQNLFEPVRNTVSDHVRPSRNVIFCTLECSYSLVLRRFLLKLHILTRLIKSFPMVYGV